jgi:uncharacterized protein YxjI
MRYVMKEKLFSWGDDFTIKDDTGRDVYFVDGKVFTWGKQLSFQDMEGNELLYIKQQLLSWGPKYEITRGGETVAMVTKELFTLFSCRFVVDVPGPDDLEAKGDFMDHEYDFVLHDRVVAKVSKAWLTFADTYGVDTLSGVDDLLILASTVVIDAACHPDDRR